MGSIERKPGAILDVDDTKRAKPYYHEFPLRVDLDRARPKLLGDLVNAKVKKGATLLEGGYFEEPTDALPFLYFYPSIGIQLCKNCVGTRDVSWLEPILREEAAFVFFKGRFADAPMEFQKLAVKHSDLFVGPKSMGVASFSQAVQDMERMFPSHQHLCTKHTKIREKEVAALLNRRLVGRQLELATEVLAAAKSLPEPASLDAMAQIESAVTNGRPREILTVGRATSAIRYNACCRVLGTQPVMSEDAIADAQFAAMAFDIDVPTGMPPARYVDLIRPHIGSLPPDLLSAGREEVLARSREINAEIRHAEQSGKLAVGRVLVGSLLPALAGAAVAFVTHGLGAHEVKQGIKDLSSRDRAETHTGVSLLSSYLDIERDAVHVWQLRQRLRGK